MPAYQVLYRKYRPRFFSDVVDQPQVTVTLKNELTRDHVAHAYLFTGSRGTGKTTCARILAQAVNCLDPQNGDPCGKCEICRGLEDGSILDVVEIDAASNNGVENIRSLIEESNFTPATAKYRVYIIDEVHMLSSGAFNALLKTLEEPPPHVIFILATTEVHKLPATILSRCQRFDFKRIDPEAIADRLEFVAKSENAEIDRDAALLIARVSDGAMRDALSLLDQCLGREDHITLDVVDRVAGVAARDYLSALAQAAAEQDVSGALELIDSLHRESKDMNRLCQEMAEYFRGLMLIKTMKDASRLVSAGPEEWEVMTRQALSMTLSSILHGMDVLEDALNKMRYRNPRAQLEMAFVRLCSPAMDADPEALLRRVEALEQGRPAQPRQPVSKPAAEKPAEPAPAEQPEETPVPEPEPAPADGPMPEESLRPEKSPQLEEPEQFTLPTEEELTEPAPVFDSAPKPVEPQPAPREETPQKAAKSAAKVDLSKLLAEAEKFRDWPEVLQLIKGDTKSVAMAFSGSSAYVSGDYLLIDASEFAFELLRQPEQKRRMREAVRQVTGRVYNLGPYRKPEEKEEEKLDPLEALARRAEESGIRIEEEE